MNKLKRLLLSKEFGQEVRMTNTCVFIVLLALKLTAAPGISWWWVFMPFIWPLVGGAVLGAFVVLPAVYDIWKDKKR